MLTRKIKRKEHSENKREWGKRKRKKIERERKGEGEGEGEGEAEGVRAIERDRH